MKKNIAKKVIIFSLVGGILLSGAVTFAESVPKLITPVNVKVERPIKNQTSEGKFIVTKDMYDVNGDTVMVPLRQVVEGVGLDITWNPNNKTAEIKYINKEMTVSIDGGFSLNGEVKDDYVKPQLKNDRLYVPANILKDGLSIDGNMYGENFVMVKESIVKDLSGFGEIIEINEGSGGYKLVTFMNNYDMQEYRLVVGDKTEIKDPITNKEVKVDELKVGDTIYTEYSGAMTRSIPPQTVASVIELVRDTAVSYTIVEKIDEGKVVVNIGTRGGVYLNILDDALIEDENGKTLSIKDLKTGDKLRVYHSQVMLPVEPLTYPTVKIVKQ